MKFLKKHPYTGLRGIGKFEWGIWWISLYQLRTGWKLGIAFDYHRDRCGPRIRFEFSLPNGNLSFNFFWDHSARLMADLRTEYDAKPESNYSENSDDKTNDQ